MNQTIIPPEEGWVPSTLYLVEASFSPTNPIHIYYFYSGFLNGPNKSPGGYNEIFRTEDHSEIKDVYYLKVLARLHTDGEVLSPNVHKLLEDINA